MSLRVYYIMCVVAMLQLLPDVVGAEYRYRLRLDGKPGSSVVALTERSLQRRERQGIALDSTDYEVSPAYLDRLSQEGLSIVTQSRWLNTVVVMRRDGMPVEDAVFARLPFVTQIDRITTTQMASSAIRTDSTEDDAQPIVEGAVIPVSDNCTMPLKQVNAYTSLYEAGYRGEGMLIAVLDAGFMKVDKWNWLGSHVVGTRDMYATDEWSSKVYTADSHGTCCLSILVSPSRYGVCGTAQDADYYLIRTETLDSESELEEDMWVAGAELADSLGADLISSSLGYYTFDSGLASHTQSEFAQYTTQISRGARAACHKGMLVCNAAGNEGNSDWRSLLFPADVEEVFTIGGINTEGGVTSFSSRGFAHPYIKPDVLARASQCYTVNVNSPTGAATSAGAGTSYATPLMAGLCASLWGAVPQLTAAQLREVVRCSASAYNSPDSIHGYGIPDFEVALALAREMMNDDQAISLVEKEACPTMSCTLTGKPMGVRREYGLIVRNGKVVFLTE